MILFPGHICGYGENLDDDLQYAKTDEERFEIFHRYNKSLKKKKDCDSKVRWTSINFNHVTLYLKNPGRFEIRIFNSSLEPKIIFQDLLLVSKLFEVSLKNAKKPNYKKKEFQNLKRHDVTEEQKVKYLLDLLFDEPKQKEIFKRRWQSVKDEEEYEDYKSGRDTFER